MSDFTIRLFREALGRLEGGNTAAMAWTPWPSPCGARPRTGIDATRHRGASRSGNTVVPHMRRG